MTSIPRGKNAPKKEIWSSLLKSVSSGKRLAEKQLVLLGGTPEHQREFVAALSKQSPTAPNDRNTTSYKPPVANEFALGYTYHDVLDADQEDILARLSIYTLTKPSPHFIPLLKPLFTPSIIPSTLLVILLDWSTPWKWISQLCACVRMLRALMIALDDECKVALEENIVEWRDRRRKGTDEGGAAGEQGAGVEDDDVALPLGPGEWDEPLGVPVSIVCQNAGTIDYLEKEKGWKEQHFDFVQQFLRTVLLKHGGSLIYTTEGSEGPLQTLVHASLGIQSTLRKKELRHNITDRYNILVPPNFDSWGKIRILTDEFDLKGVSEAWSNDIQDLPPLNGNSSSDPSEASTSSTATGSGLAASLYATVINDPSKRSAAVELASGSRGIEVTTKDLQAFLAEQNDVLEGFQREDQRNERKELLAQASKKTPVAASSAAGDVEDHIGPVQFNMGGIQMDAENVVKRLKDREASRSAEAGSSSEPPTTPTGQKPESQGLDDTKLYNFFSSLKGQSSNSPRRNERKD